MSLTTRAALVFALFVGFVLALVAAGAFFTLRPTEQAIVTEFGKPKGDPVTDAGLHFKLPFIQNVQRIPKQVLEWDGDRTDMPTRDKLYMSVDMFARWRVVRPLDYFTKLRDERSAESRLDDILGSETRTAVAKHDLIELVRTDKARVPLRDEVIEEMAEAAAGELGVLPQIRKGRKVIEAEIKAAAAEKLLELGIELLDIRFKRINYNPSVVDNIYERMKAERDQIASRFLSEGQGEAAKILGSKERDLDEIESEAYRQVQEIQGKADAEATAIYASAYNQSADAADLYEFLKTMETYKAVIDSGSTLVLSTDSDLFRFLKDMEGDIEKAANSGGASGLEPAPMLDLRVNPFGE